MNRDRERRRRVKKKYSNNEKTMEKGWVRRLGLGLGGQKWVLMEHPRKDNDANRRPASICSAPLSKFVSGGGCKKTKTGPKLFSFCVRSKFNGKNVCWYFLRLLSATVNTKAFKYKLQTFSRKGYNLDGRIRFFNIHPKKKNLLKKLLK